jgi:hypothetical protein
MTAPARVGGSSSRGRSSQSRKKAAAAAAAAASTEAPEKTPPEAPLRTERRPRTAAAERAYARRAQREGRTVEPVKRGPRQKPERGTASRASFVMLVMGLLAAGVVTTLWLSTQAIADSYRLDQVKKAATELGERAEVLQREVATAESASTLADLARKLGMVPSGDPTRLIVGADGKVAVVGDPKPVVTSPPSASVDVPPPPVAPDQAPPEQPGDQQAQQPQGGTG